MSRAIEAPNLLASVRNALSPLRMNRDWQFPVGVFLVFRILFSLWTLLIVTQFPAPTPEVATASGSMVFAPVRDGIGYYVLEPWDRWDTHWYKWIAAQGYAATNGSFAFFPLYPILIRAFVAATGGETWTLAALVISNLAAVIAFLLLFQLVQEWFDEPTARASLLFLVTFPIAFFLFAGYTESLFLVWVLGGLLLARHGQWSWAGGATALAGLTRLPGLGMLLPLGILFYEQYRAGRVRWQQGARFLALSALGSGFWIYTKLATLNEPNAQAMSMWRTLELPGANLGLTLQILWEGAKHAPANNFLDVCMCLFFVAMVLWGVFTLPRVLSAYSLVMLLPALVSVQTLVPTLPLASFPRYALIVFPVFISLARLPLGSRGRLLVQTVTLILELFLLALFVQWVWIA